MFSELCVVEDRAEVEVHNRSRPVDSPDTTPSAENPEDAAKVV